MKAVICAAGEGTRLGLGIPKCLVEVGGKKIIDWQLEALQGFEIYVVVGFQAEKVIDYLQDKKCQIIRNNEWQTTTTAHSIALTGINENCLILDGDLIFSHEEISFLNFDFEWLGVTDRKTEFPVLINFRKNGDILFEEKNSCFEWACICYTNPSYFILYENRFVYQVLNSVPIKKGQYIDSYEIDSPRDLQGATGWMKERFNLSGKTE